MTLLDLEYLYSPRDQIPDRRPSPEALPAAPKAVPIPLIRLPLLPLDQQFDTWEKDFQAMNMLAKPHGYAITSRGSTTTKTGAKKTYGIFATAAVNQGSITELEFAVPLPLRLNVRSG